MSVWISDEKLLIFNSLLGVSSGDETLHLIFDILKESRCLRSRLRKNVKLGTFTL